MKKRFLSIMLALCLCLSLLPVTAGASGTAANNLSITKDGATSYYETLAGAFEAATSGDEIVVLQNYAESTGTTMPDKNLTLNFGEYTITAANSSDITIPVGSLTLKGTTGGYGGTFNMYNSEIGASAVGSLTVCGGTHGNILLGTGTLTFQGGTVSEMILQHQGTNLTVEGGTIGLLMVYGGTTTLKGGTFTGVTVPEEELLDGKGIIAYPGNAETMSGMLDNGMKFDKEVQTGVVTDQGTEYTIAYCAGGVKVVADEAEPPAGDDQEATLKNDGYPYGKNMSSSSVTLVIEAENATTYQWQSASEKSGEYANISEAAGSILTLTSPTSGTWYRCVVNGTESKAVQIVSPGSDGRTWTAYSGSYYITNGTMAYRVNGAEFDVTGLYQKNGTNYMLQTSYADKWAMYSSTSATPDATSSASANAQLAALRVAFSEDDNYAVLFEAVLADGQKAFAFGCDTQLGDYSTSGSYSDDAALIATVKNNTLEQVAMIGAASEAAAVDTDPAFVIAPDSSTPASKFWIGHYSYRKAYAYNTTDDGYTTIESINGTEVVTRIEGDDSGMTMSWLNVSPGGSVKFQFKVGSVADTGAVSGSAINVATGDVTLELSKAATSIVVKVGGNTLTEGTHYTIDSTSSTSPKITFLAAAGLTSESQITVEVTLTGETQAQTVNIQNNIPAPTYTVTFDVQGHGTAPDAIENITSGSTIAAPTDPTADDYTFGGWYKEAGCTNAWSFSSDTVTEDITLYAKWTQNSTPVPPAPPIYIPPVHRCTSKCDVCGGCEDADCTYSVCKDKCLLLSMDFADVEDGKWYTDAVEYVYHRGMMGSVSSSESIFNINGTTSRAMIVTILWRLEGCPVVNYLMQYDDVEEGKWYSEAIRWATSTGIVTGYGDTFGPNDPITREQMAAILWRYAKHKGYDVSVGEDTSILSYEDAFDISEYAIPAMQWACGAGVMEGDGVNLTPAANVTRCQSAALLMRFCELDK